MPLGSLQKGSIDIINALVTFQENTTPNDGLEYLIKISCSDNSVFEVKLVE